ncbi:MAG: sensor histidine kinase [Myxococcales bacterium]|nr:sensor histidine kinase [Myxococcales bacterium]MCB9645201.1 sensor histidine kinase [Deltaproteobacteria bacterium]
MSVQFGGAAALDPSQAGEHEDPAIMERFSDRARALFYARLAFLAIGLCVLAVPSWSQFLGITDTAAFLVYFGVIAYSVTNFLLIDHPKLGRPVTFATLVLDLLALAALVTPGGGLRSPMMAGHVMYTIFFVLFFPKRYAIVPPLLLLPLVAFLQEGALVSQGVFLMLWYSVLSFIAAYLLLYLHVRDQRRINQLRVLSKSQEAAIVTEERLRLAREIHDGLGGQLSTLIIQAEYIQRMSRDPNLTSEITELKSQAEEAIDELRRSLTMMRRDFDLHKALEDYCIRFQERSRSGCTFKVRGRQRRLPSEMQLSIFRVLQECLTNIQKHAEAKNTDVRLKYDGEMVSLVVSDDGVGFDATAKQRSGHYGLTNLLERAKKFRGTMDIQSAPGNGTTVHVTLVVPAEGSHVAFMPDLARA